jgi:hypothetical protein
MVQSSIIHRNKAIDNYKEEESYVFREGMGKTTEQEGR